LALAHQACEQLKIGVFFQTIFDDIMKTNHRFQAVRNTGGGCVALLIVMIYGALPVFAGLIQPVTIVNTPAVAPSGGSGDSLSPVMSPDGRYVLFASSANNLTLSDSVNPTPPTFPPVMNIYLRDRLQQATTLVSVNLDGTGAGNGDSIPAGISSNGRFALFESAANNLVPGDTNGANDVFVRDLTANKTTLVSVSTNGGTANRASRSAVLTPDGRYVAFVSEASNLVADDTNGIPDVFARDLQSGTTSLASAGAMPFMVSSSELPLITPDGRFVAFYSAATNLVTGITNSGEIYVRDLLQEITVWASTNAHSILQALRNSPAGLSCNQAISDDGQFVAYEACPPSGSGVALRYSMATGLTDIVNTNVAGILPGLELNERNLSMTPDACFVAFVTNVDGINTGVAVWDAQSNATVIASVDLTQTAVTNAICDWPAITPDGRFVAFMSNATNLTANPVTTGFHLYVRDLLAGTSVLVDADTNGAGSTPNLMTFPRLSDSGSVVAFECLDGSLVPNDINRAYDVFARDLKANSAELISVGLPGLTSLTPNASVTISSSSVSTDGSRVAFWSEADNLTAGDTDGLRDVYVRDLTLGENILASVNTNGVSDNGLSTDPAISGDGRFVAFTSTSSDLVVNPFSKGTNVFLRDLQNGVTSLVSVNTNGNAPGNAPSYSPEISADGRYVLFISQASDIAPGSVGNSIGNLFWRDRQSGTNRTITSYASSTLYNPINAAMTPDGQRVVYRVQLNSISATCYVWDALLGKNIYTNIALTAIYQTAISPDGNQIVFYQTNQVVLVNLSSKSQVLFSNSLSRAGCQFSADSRWLAYVAGTNQIFLYDVSTGSNILVSAGANGSCDSPTISADGRFVAYRSRATNLVVNATNGVPNIFLYDSLAGTTTLVSDGALGGWPANGASLSPVFSGDGQRLFWQSWANNLAGQDFNQWCNLYALQSFATNSSGNGEPFNISAFGISSLASLGSAASAATLAWPASPDANYAVQFTDKLEEPDWQTLTNGIQIIGTQGYLLDVLTNSSQRFYRVVGF
jgi:hypothetical protein